MGAAGDQPRPAVGAARLLGGSLRRQLAEHRRPQCVEVRIDGDLVAARSTLTGEHLAAYASI